MHPTKKMKKPFWVNNAKNLAHFRKPTLNL